MAEEKVLARYTDPALANRFSTKPFETSRGHAESLRAKGWAIILSTPTPHPTLSIDELDEIKEKYKKDSVLYVAEDKFITNIAWVTGEFVDIELRKIGSQCGFKTSIINSSSLTPGKLILSDLVILSTELKGFTDVQIIQIKSVLFQKNTPYIYLIERDVFDTDNGIHFLMDSKLNVFKNEELFEIAVDKMGELISENWLIMGSNFNQFWKKINEVIA